MTALTLAWATKASANTATDKMVIQAICLRETLAWSAWPSFDEASTGGGELMWTSVRTTGSGFLVGSSTVLFC